MSVLTYHNDGARTGQNLNETVLTPANVNSNTFAKLFSYNVDGYVYAQPLYVAGMEIPGRGTHNVLFIATEHNTLYAFDADSNLWATNGLLWKVNFGVSAVTPNADFGTRYNNGQYTDIVPEVGITATPVIDPIAGTIFLDAFTHEGSAYVHRIHALNITNGLERANSPVVVSGSVAGVGVGTSGGRVSFVPMQHNVRSAITMANGILYVTFTSFADTNPYHGWIMGYDPVTLQQRTNYMFNTTPNSTIAAYGANAGEGGIWMGGGGLAVDASSNLFFMVGNAPFTATNNSGGTEYGDSFMKLGTASGLSVADYFTPFNQSGLSTNDTDLGSGGVMLLPDQPGNTPHLLVGAGKEGKIYLLNRDQMTTNNTHHNAGGTTDPVLQTIASQIGRSGGTPTYYNGRVYYGGWNSSLRAFAVAGGLLSTTPVLTASRSLAFPGATPSISANGANNGIVWIISYTNTSIAAPGVLVAYNATNLATELYNSAQAAANRDRITNCVKCASPIVANGKVYAGGKYSVAVFGLNDPSLLWRTFHFGSNATNSSVSGDFADPDNDGALNLLEYAVGSDPTTPGNGKILNASFSGPDFVVTFNRNASATDIGYSVETSPDLSAWSAAINYASASGWVPVTGGSATESVPSGVPPDQSVSVTVDLGPPSANSLFVRLRVHR